MTIAKNLGLLAPQVSSSGTISYNSLTNLPQVISLKCTSLVYPGNDLAADTAGGQTISIVGTGFEATPTVYVGGVIASSVTFVSSTQINFVAPARPAGTYDIYVVNPGGATAIFVFGISYSGVPNWTTSAGSLGTFDGPISVQLQATSNSAVSYALAGGSTLPSGITLSSSGLLSGTLNTDQTFSFTVVANDLENQDTSRSFQVTVDISDPYFKYNTLLLSANGTNAAQNNTFVDSSTNNFSITRNGNTSQGTFSPYGPNWSNYFEGSGDYLDFAQSSGFTMGTGDFTIECWYYLRSSYATGNGYLVDLGTNGTRLQFYNNQIYFTTVAGSGVTATAGAGQAVGTWYHLAAVRSGSIITLYLNGTSIGTSSNSSNLTDNDCRIGNYGGGTGYVFNAYISNFRIVKGTAVYTSAFTPPTAPLTAVSGTSLLTCQSNRFRDASTNNFTPTINGVSVQRFSPFNPTAPYAASTDGGSGYFDGSGDYLTAANNAAFDFGTGNFTVECFVYVSSFVAAETDVIVSNYQNTTNGWTLGIFGSTNKFYGAVAGDGSRLDDTGTLPTNQWAHLCLVRSGTTLSFFVNGSRVATATNSTNITSTSALTIGTNVGGGALSFNGYLSGLRIVKGTAVYDPAQTTLTVPTAPPTAVTNTQFLTNFTNAGIIDNAEMNVLETAGNAQISTAQSKFGGSSLYFDGSGDWLVVPYNDNFRIGAQNYTVECWVKTTGSTMDIIGAFNGTSPFTGWLFGIGFLGSGNVGKLSFYHADSSTSQNFIGTNTVNNDAWRHIAMTKAGNTLRFFIDGVLDSTHTLTITSGGSNEPIIIGADSNPTKSRPFNGYLDDLRITKGYARYTANFTPPTSAHKLK